MEERPTFQDQPATLPGFENALNIGKQFESTYKPNNVPEGHKVSITTNQEDVPKIIAGGGYFPELTADDRGDARRETESELFGIPKDAPATARPAYGWLRPEDNPHPLRSYGDVTLDVSPDALSDATTTSQDSVYRLRSGMPSDMEPLTTEARPGRHEPGRAFGGHTPTGKVSYREVQIPGGVPLENIEGAHVNSYESWEDDDATVAMRDAAAEFRANELRRAGMPTTVHKTEYIPSLFENQDPDDNYSGWSTPHNPNSVKGEWRTTGVLSSGSDPTTASPQDDLDVYNAANTTFNAAGNDESERPSLSRPFNPGGHPTKRTSVFADAAAKDDGLPVNNGETVPIDPNKVLG